MQVDETLALRMIAESKELGLEMFHLDAGWFRGVGDWYPDPKKFPHGLGFIADAAHQAGTALRPLGRLDPGRHSIPNRAR